MKESVGTTGLIFNEPLLWEKGAKGRNGFSLPPRDIDRCPLDDNIRGDGPDFPDLSELDVVRHFTRLSQWNFGVDSGMYPLGSCTMKYNPKTNERQAALPGLAGSHPLLPQALSQGALKMMFNLQHYLAEITGLPAVTLQPAAGSHGELTGMMMINAYLKNKGQTRSKVLIPDTAHGTNPTNRGSSRQRGLLRSWMKIRPESWSPTPIPWDCLKRTSNRWPKSSMPKAVWFMVTAPI
jgi:glycine dehydrogenase subunit 2